MKELHGTIAAVTGAASGIGRALAVALAEEGCEIAIADVNAHGLRETASMLVSTGVRVSEHVVDVGVRQQVYRFADEVNTQHGQVDLIINNAGVGLASTLEAVSYEDFEWIMAINFWGVVYGSRAFLPHLKARPEAHICNVSSVHGLFTNPGVGPYSSSKFAVRGFTLALAQELKGTSVTVSCVHPGGIKTAIARNTRYPEGASPEERERNVAFFDRWIAHTSPDRAARTIVHGIKRGRARILVGVVAHIFDLAARAFPSVWQRLMGRIA
jgi:NAD(P)-dependent dehydrogenase (short-subunit alcohol dehydrogenase family)